MYYYLKVKRPVPMSKDELNTVVKSFEGRDQRTLTEIEISNIEDNVNKDEKRIGTLGMIEFLVLNYCPTMGELKNQLDFQELRRRFKDFNHDEYSYFKFEGTEYELIKKLLTHDQYLNTDSAGNKRPLVDVGGTLSLIFNMPNVEPEDYKIKN